MVGGVPHGRDAHRCIGLSGKQEDLHAFFLDPVTTGCHYALNKPVSSRHRHPDLLQYIFNLFHSRKCHRNHTSKRSQSTARWNKRHPYMRRQPLLLANLLPVQHRCQYAELRQDKDAVAVVRVACYRQNACCCSIYAIVQRLHEADPGRVGVDAAAHRLVQEESTRCYLHHRYDAAKQERLGEHPPRGQGTSSMIVVSTLNLLLEIWRRDFPSKTAVLPSLYIVVPLQNCTESTICDTYRRQGSLARICDENPLRYK